MLLELGAGPDQVKCVIVFFQIPILVLFYVHVLRVLRACFMVPHDISDPCYYDCLRVIASLVLCWCLVSIYMFVGCLWDADVNVVTLACVIHDTWLGTCPPLS